MTNNEIATGVVYGVLPNMQEILTADKAALTLWEDSTPLARNEWICWVEGAKKPQTRCNRIERVRTAHGT